MALNLGESTRSKAFRALVTRLQTHRLLKGTVKVWRTWEGKPDDEAPPTLGQLPWVRLTPMVVPATRKAAHPGAIRRTGYLSPIKVHIEMATLSSNWDDAAALWERFEAVLWPQDPTERAAWERKRLDLGIGDMHLLQPALPTGLDNLSTDLTVSDGFIQLDLQVIL